MLFRHEEKFIIPGLGFIIKDNLSSDEIKQRLKINQLKFDMGQVECKSCSCKTE